MVLDRVTEHMLFHIGYGVVTTALNRSQGVQPRELNEILRKNDQLPQFVLSNNALKLFMYKPTFWSKFLILREGNLLSSV